MQCRAIVHDCFENDEGFLQAAERGLVSVVNSVKNSAELLAIFADSVLKKGGSAARQLRRVEHGCREALRHVILCLRFVLDRQTFQEHYVAGLARRLISDSSASLEAEELMAHELRFVCSRDFTSRLERMLADKARSLESHRVLAAQGGDTLGGVAGREGEDGGVHNALNVLLLTAGTWPLAEPAQEVPVLPAPLLAQMHSFTQAYESLYKRRRLTWRLDLSRAQVRATFLHNKYEITMSLMQMVVLLAFEDSGRGGGAGGSGERAAAVGAGAEMLSVSYLSQVTALPAVQVENLVRSLVRARLLLLRFPGGIAGEAATPAATSAQAGGPAITIDPSGAPIFCDGSDPSPSFGPPPNFAEDDERAVNLDEAAAAAAAAAAVSDDEAEEAAAAAAVAAVVSEEEEEEALAVALSLESAAAAQDSTAAATGPLAEAADGASGGRGARGESTAVGSMGQEEGLRALEASEGLGPLGTLADLQMCGDGEESEEEGGGGSGVFDVVLEGVGKGGFVGGGGASSSAGSWVAGLAEEDDDDTIDEEEEGEMDDLVGEGEGAAGVAHGAEAAWEGGELPGMISEVAGDDGEGAAARGESESSVCPVYVLHYQAPLGRSL